MKATIIHKDFEIIHIESDFESNKEMLQQQALKRLELHYKDDINQIEIDGKVIKFKIELKELKS